MRRARVRAGDAASGRPEYGVKSILTKSAFPNFHRQERQPATAIAIPGETIHEDIPQETLCTRPASENEVSPSSKTNTGSRKHDVATVHPCFVRRLRQRVVVKGTFANSTNAPQSSGQVPVGAGAKFGTQPLSERGNPLRRSAAVLETTKGGRRRGVPA